MTVQQHNVWHDTSPKTTYRMGFNTGPKIRPCPFHLFIEQFLVRVIARWSVASQLCSYASAIFICSFSRGGLPLDVGVVGQRPPLFWRGGFRVEHGRTLACCTAGGGAHHPPTSLPAAPGSTLASRVPGLVEPLLRWRGGCLRRRNAAALPRCQC